MGVVEINTLDLKHSDVTVIGPCKYLRCGAKNLFPTVMALNKEISSKITDFCCLFLKACHLCYQLRIGIWLDNVQFAVQCSLFSPPYKMQGSLLLY